MRIPGKVMLLGEYAVLLGARATMWTFPSSAPGFRWVVDSSTRPFHPQSPAGKIQPAPCGQFLRDLRWGGFGASSAEFLAAYRTNHPQASSREVWNAFRALHVDLSVAPSGADLLAQIAAVDHPTRRWIEVQNGEVVDTANPSGVDLHLAVFAVPDRKVATHQHLQSLRPNDDWIRVLSPLLESAHLAFKNQDLKAFALHSTQYADALQSFGLEDASAHEDRCWALEQPGVWGAKGTGALLADAVVVWFEHAHASLPFARAASARGWKAVWLNGQAIPDEVRQ
jgi:mevalonate kinase